MADASPVHNPDENRGLMIADNHQADKIRKGMMINHNERNCLRNDSAWHHVHATKNHPMLSPIVSPEGAPLDCNHVCPTAICSDWQEQGDNAISSGFNLALRIYSNVPLRHGHCKHSIRRICTEQYGRNRNVTLSKEMYS